MEVGLSSFQYEVAAMMQSLAGGLIASKRPVSHADGANDNPYGVMPVL